MTFLTRRLTPVILFVMTFSGITGRTAEDNPASATPPQDTTLGQLISIPVGGESVQGWFVPPADETSFRFKLKEGGFIVELYWNDFSPNNAKYIRSLFGLDLDNKGKIAFGRDIPAVKVTLQNSGKVYYGVIHPENVDDSDVLLLTTKSSPRLSIPKKNIYKVKPVTVKESVIYTNKEIYEREMAQRGKNISAEGHLEIARMCLLWELPDEGLEHLERAQILNEALQEDELKQQLETLRETQAEKKLNDKIMSAYRSGNFSKTLELIDQYLRVFPDNPRASFISHLRADADVKLTDKIGDTIVLDMYQKLDDVIAGKLRAKVYEGESMKGLRIYTTRGDYSGMLVDSNDEEITIQTSKGDTVIIKRNAIRRMIDVDIGEGDKVDVSLNDMIRWVETGDCKKALLGYVAEQVGIEPDQVEEIWNKRLESVIEVTRSGAHKIQHRKVINQTASWGAGSWLRAGTELVSPKILTTGRIPGNIRAKIRKINALPKPEEWWSKQSLKTKKMIIRAMAAEMYYDVIRVEEVTDTTCGGKGYTVEQIPSSNGYVTFQKRCPNCMGAGKIFKVIYR